MSVVFLKKTKTKKSFFLKMSEDHLDKLGRFDTNCLDPNPVCFLNGVVPCVITSTDSAGNVVSMCDLTTNVPVCEKTDFSDTPNHDEASEAFIFHLFGMNERVCNVFEPSEHRGVSANYREYQFSNPETLRQKPKQDCINALRNPPETLRKPLKRAANFVPLEDYAVSIIMDALPGISSNNPVTLDDDSEYSETD